MQLRAACLAAGSALVASAVARADVPHWNVWLCGPGSRSTTATRAGSRSWLLITRIQHAGNPRPSAQPIL
jgi:hypothetical protein